MSRVPYHLALLGAAALAFAAGAAWGLGPFGVQAQTTVQTQTRELTAEQRQLKARVAELEDQARAGDAVLSAVSTPLLADQLPGRTVAMFVLPGAPAALVERAARALKDAGAGIAITVTITEEYVDPDRAVSPLEDLALRLVPPGVTFADGSSAIERVGTVLARSTVTARADESGKVDSDAAEVLAGLQELGALDVVGEPGTRAELAVLVAGTPRSADAGAGPNRALVGLAQALDRGGRGAVALGSPASARGGGMLASVRASRSKSEGVSTVDLGSSEIGPAAGVLALAEQLRGESGHYGLGPRAERVIPRFVRPTKP